MPMVTPSPTLVLNGWFSNGILKTVVRHISILQPIGSQASSPCYRNLGAGSQFPKKGNALLH